MASRETSAEWQTYRRLLFYAKPYSARIFLGLFFGMIFGGSYLGILMSLKKNLGAMFDASTLPLNVILSIAALLPLCTVFMGIGNFFSKYLVEWVGNRVVMDLRTQTFAHIHDLSLLYFTRSRTGELISRTANDSALVERAVSTVLGDLVREPFVLASAVGYLFWLDWHLCLVSLLVFPLCIIPVAIFGRRVRKSSREGQEKLADIVSILQETITGVRVVKAFGMEDYEKARFNQRSRSVFSRLMRVTKAKASVEPMIVVISSVGLSAVLVYAKLVNMPMEEFFTFAAALMMMYQPVKNLSKIHLNIQHSSAAADRIFEVLDTKVSVVEAPDAVPFKGRIETVQFDHVSFNYDEPTPILSDISFSVKAGECVAFVGSSGSGKTTLVSLLPRFFDPTGGQILFNGEPAQKYTLASLRAQMGIVTQETILFNDTVANNIAYGDRNAPREAIEQAARKAHAHDFIMEMPEGYETMIGERGVRLSGGQCQRLAIARAMLRNPPVLILDEATSALDTESERQVQAALDELMAHRTVFAIAHRLSTIAHADRIIVLDKGRIAEQGTHQELIARGGVYKYLYDLQFSK
ncbi:MAG: ABC transporter ATP-binding protein [Kiritimatiellia bacterium]